MTVSPQSPFSPGNLPLRNEFDEDAYLEFHPDVAAAVSAGIVGSGWQHFTLHGFAEHRRWVPKADRMLGVSPEISPGDGMFHGNREHYLDVGQSALHCIEAALFAANQPKAAIRRILDLPCGHGRVLRFLRKRFPSAELTAVDLDPEGVDFCTRVFGAAGIVSDVEPERIKVQGEFDLIWCGSLLTHLPQAKCVAFLRLFRRLLAPGGVMAFTTHGRHYERQLASGVDRNALSAEQIRRLLEDFHRSGFGYVDYAGTRDYGFSLAHPAFVIGSLLAPEDWRLIGVHEQGWDGKQDVICLQKEMVSSGATE